MNSAKMTGGSNVSASEQLYKLADRAKQSEESIDHAKEESRAELKSRVEQARQASERQAAALKGGAGEVEAKASRWWVDVQDDWNKHIDKIRKDVGERKAEHDVKRAEHHAEHREDDAEAAVAFAYAAFEEAEYAVLDAILARQEADVLVAAR
jgi:hypothetical protein